MMATFLFSVLPEQERQMTTRLSPISPAPPRQTGGFTLIELLIVVAMIAVLATIAFPILLRARISSNEGVADRLAAHDSLGPGRLRVHLRRRRLRPDARRPVAEARRPARSASSRIPYVTNGVIQNGYVAIVMAADGATTMLPAGNTCNGSAADAVTGFVAERHPSAVAETGVRVVRHRHRRARCTCATTASRSTTR